MEDDEFSWDDPRTRSFGVYKPQLVDNFSSGRWGIHSNSPNSVYLPLCLLLRLIFHSYLSYLCSNYAKHVISCHVLCLKWSIFFTAAIAPCYHVSAPCFRTECLEQLLGLAPEELSSKAFVDLLQDEDGSATVTMLTMRWKQHGKMRWLISHGVNYESTIFRMR